MYATAGSRSNEPRRSPRAAAAGSAAVTMVRPKVSINLTNDENMSVCVCSVYASADNVHAAIDGTICPQCQNIIKQQSTDHRKTLISKRLTIANDIIVNRVDMHHLNLNSLHVQDPYTPESCESHSPFPDDKDESRDGSQDRSASSDERGGDDDGREVTLDTLVYDDDGNLSETIESTEGHAKPLTVKCTDVDCHLYKSRKSGRGVSPRQLKSRLENLRRTTHRREHGDGRRRSSRKHEKSQGCFDRHCQLL